METLRMESRRKWFLAQLESLRRERLRMERCRKTFSLTGITQKGKTRNGKIWKNFKPQLESLRMERLRIERYRKTLSLNWNHIEWKDSEWKEVEKLLALTGITQNGKTQKVK
jgi:hypothetical protein